MMLLLTWLVTSVPAALLLGRAMASDRGVRPAPARQLPEWRHEPAAA